MFILGVIPARAGSKGIENKNIYPLCGKPLYKYTTDAAMKSKLKYVCITTDIIDFDNGNYKIFIRPKPLSEDNTPMLPVIQHVVKEYEKNYNKRVDAVMTLQTTSPLRTTEDINKAIRDFCWNNKHVPCGVDSLYSGYYMGIKHKNKTYDKHVDKPHFQRNGAIFITRRDLLNQGKLWSDNAIEFEMPKSRSIDIDDMDDMYMAECILKNPKEVKK